LGLPAGRPQALLRPEKIAQLTAGIGSRDYGSTSGFLNSIPAVKAGDPQWKTLFFSENLGPDPTGRRFTAVRKALLTFDCWPPTTAKIYSQ